MEKRKYTFFIAVDCRPFASVEDAACGELQTDWSGQAAMKSRACTECYGAVDLKNHLDRLAPHEEFCLCDRIPAAGDGIVIGRLAAERLRTLPHPPTAPAAEEFVIETIIQGDRTLNLLAGDNGPSTLHAVSAYLNALGVRWYSPSPGGTCFPNDSGNSPKEPFSLPSLSIRETPAFQTRACYSEVVDDSDMAFLDWMMHNRLNFVYFEQYQHPEQLKKRGIQICMGGHNILSRFLPPSKYYANHPDWFGLVNGARSANIGKGDVEGFGDNFCTSNQEAVQELCRNIVGALTKGPLF